MRLILPLALLIAGCATKPSMHPAGDSRPLVAPATLAVQRAANQVVRGAFGDRELTINCVLSVRGDTLTVIGLTAMGVRAFTLRYDGRTVSVDNDLPVPPQLTPERLLADIQLVFWPLGALQAQWAATDWRVSEPAPGTRRLRRGETLVAEVHYTGADPWSGRSWLVNVQHGYTLGIDSTPMGGQQ